MDRDEQLTARQFQEAGQVEDWRVLDWRASAWFDAPSHAAGAALARRTAELAGSADRLPDMDVRAGGVQVRIGGPAFTGLTMADVAVARAISAAARELGLTADPSALQTVQLAFDALDQPAVKAFWRGMLGYEEVGEEDLLDPMRRDPGIWFQQQDEPRPLRNRIHLDIVRPYELTTQARDAVAAAGGREMYGGEYYATVADAEGNEADLIPLGGAGAGPAQEVQKAVDMLGEGPETADWRVLFGAMTFYPTTSPVQAAELAAAVAGLADDVDFPLLVDLRSEGVTIDTGKDLWEDERFGDLARRVQAAARGLGLTADPSPLRFLQVGIDVVDIPAVREFWRALLGYVYDPRPWVTDINDPRRRGPTLFFQEMEATEVARRRQRNRIHIDVLVPEDQARARIETAIAAGGRLLYERAPESWTLADPEGNEVDIAVQVGRAELRTE